MKIWNVAKSENLYGVKNWGEGYFGINEKGNLTVNPNRNGHAVDLYEIINKLVRQGIHAPILVRFDGILKDRIKSISGAFNAAISESAYEAQYFPVYPIKVNQQAHVVDAMKTAGKDFGLGLEVGSKPELLAAFALHDIEGTPLLCNGYKDREYLELALLSRKIGRRTIIIIEQLSELKMVLELSQQLHIKPEIGLRMKPVSKGCGRWESSGGDRAKFGLSTDGIIEAIKQLKEAGADDALKLLHYHIGSQITSIAAIKQVLKEATKMFTEIAKLCPSLCFFDVGGGLAVDYDGSRTNYQSSMNYTIDEYARDVVYAIQDACKEANVKVPNIITESGRAMVAHHSVLIAQVVDRAAAPAVPAKLEDPPSRKKLLSEMSNLYSDINLRNCIESLHDAISMREEALQQFIAGKLNLLERGYIEKSFWHLAAKVAQIAQESDLSSEEIEDVQEAIRDTYFCNFSVFQSLPDFWAIDQLFPIMPIHRLAEEPTSKAVIADMSCDSDGEIDKFIDIKDVKKHINLHPLEHGQPYYLGFFLVGAYQEILGDLHNLFGDTNAVHIDVTADGIPEVTHLVAGDSIREVLEYVQYNTADLTERLRMSMDREIFKGNLEPEEAAKLKDRFWQAIQGYTYLYHDQPEVPAVVKTATTALVAR